MKFVSIRVFIFCLFFLNGWAGITQAGMQLFRYTPSSDLDLTQERQESPLRMYEPFSINEGQQEVDPAKTLSLIGGDEDPFLQLAQAAGQSQGHATGDTPDVDTRARQVHAADLNNPVASVWTLEMENNFSLMDGDITAKVREVWLTNFQPILPIPLTGRWNLVARPIIPMLSGPIPQTSGRFEHDGGLGDITLQTYLTPTITRGLIWAAGPLLQMPSATSDSLGSEKWSAGPAVALLSVSEELVYGILLTHNESFAGDDDRADVSLTALQYFFSYIFDNNWQVGIGSPIIQADWEADSDDRWTVPIGIAVGKTTEVFGTTLQWSVEAYYSVIHPDTYGDRWTFRLSLKPVMSPPIKKPLFGY